MGISRKEEMLKRERRTLNAIVARLKDNNKDNDHARHGPQRGGKEGARPRADAHERPREAPEGTVRPHNGLTTREKGAIKQRNELKKPTKNPTPISRR